jgi:hypothetical protein
MAWHEWNMSSEMLDAWGPERTRQVSPLDEWLAAGASLAAGTDIARPFKPRAVSPPPPFWRLTAPVAWSTIALTLSSDGSADAQIAAASPFPRHYLYDGAGRLTHQTPLIRYNDWIRQSGHQDSPWGGGGRAVPSGIG